MYSRPSIGLQVRTVKNEILPHAICRLKQYKQKIYIEKWFPHKNSRETWLLGIKIVQTTEEMLGRNMVINISSLTLANWNIKTCDVY